jgi:hypothetical protein
MTAGQSFLQSSLRGIQEPPQASYRPIVPLSADNRLISPAAVRSFAHELVPAAIGLRGRENIPDIALLMDAVTLRHCSRLDGSAWCRRAAASCASPSRRGGIRLQRFRRALSGLPTGSRSPEPATGLMKSRIAPIQGDCALRLHSPNGIRDQDGSAAAVLLSPLLRLVDEAAIEARHTALGCLADSNASVRADRWAAAPSFEPLRRVLGEAGEGQHVRAANLASYEPELHRSARPSKLYRLVLFPGVLWSGAEASNDAADG